MLSSSTNLSYDCFWKYGVVESVAADTGGRRWAVNAGIYVFRVRLRCAGNVVRIPLIKLKKSYSYSHSVLSAKKLCLNMLKLYFLRFNIPLKKLKIRLKLQLNEEVMFTIIVCKLTNYLTVYRSHIPHCLFSVLSCLISDFQCIQYCYPSKESCT